MQQIEEVAKENTSETGKVVEGDPGLHASTNGASMSAEIYRIVPELEGRGETRSERSVEKVSEEALARERSSRGSRIASAAT